jgi:hypothetical protein
VEAQDEDVIIVHGGCPTGADEAAHQTAARLERDEFIFRARWNTSGRSAGPKRNTRMAKFLARIQAVVAFATCEAHFFFKKGAKNIGTENAYLAAKRASLTSVRHE